MEGFNFLALFVCVSATEILTYQCGGAEKAILITQHFPNDAKSLCNPPSSRSAVGVASEDSSMGRATKENGCYIMER
jgi:hypothetical protein